MRTPWMIASGGQVRIEDRRQPRHGFGRRGARAQQRHVGPVGFDDQLRRRREPVGDEQTGQIVAEHAAQHGRPLGAVEGFEVADFALAEDEDAATAKVGVESRQREAGLLRVRDGDVAAETVGAGQQLEVERAGIGQIAQYGGDGHAGRLAGCGQRSLSCATSTAVTVSPALSIRSSRRVRR